MLLLCEPIEKLTLVDNRIQWRLQHKNECQSQSGCVSNELINQQCIYLKACKTFNRIGLKRAITPLKDGDYLQSAENKPLLSLISAIKLSGNNKQNKCNAAVQSTRLEVVRVDWHEVGWRKSPTMQQQRQN
jgi:hypothetical protein